MTFTGLTYKVLNKVTGKTVTVSVYGCFDHDLAQAAADVCAKMTGVVNTQKVQLVLDAATMGLVGGRSLMSPAVAKAGH
jgi:hypothetical protein